ATGSQVEYWSPTGMASRAIVPHTEEKLPLVGEEDVRCTDCLKYCLHRDENKSHCIYTALTNAQRGNVERGLVFCGGRVGDIKEILPVAEVFRNLVTPAAGEEPVHAVGAMASEDVADM
ncbi:MAG TPA: hypothetical protein VNT75_28995, partial [Symbiobacteriaceae bacterium]|nr:hypothetical protein [Symbiobacteriaceae bacterium]